MVVKVVKVAGKVEVVVVKEPSESVVTITTAVSVTGLPLESVLVSVVVKVVKVVGKMDVLVVKIPSESVVISTSSVSVRGPPVESVVVIVVVYSVYEVGASIAGGSGKSLQGLQIECGVESAGTGPL